MDDYDDKTKNAKDSNLKHFAFLFDFCEPCIDKIMGSGNRVPFV